MTRRLASSQNDVCGSQGDSTALEALKRMVRGSFERACLLSADVAYFDEPQSEQEKNDSEGQATFEMISRQVRAAQRAGEIKAADALLMTALILGSVVGAANLAQNGGAERKNCINEGECYPLLLLELLTTKKCH